MGEFRFAVMGAGNIAERFCRAAGLLEGCRVVAVASRSAERAEAFAEKCGLAASYGSYERMLQEEKPDCVYIAATTDAHYALTMLCLDYRVPVLCEKAMFMTRRQADAAFSRAARENVFVMEAMWSRFLPAVREAKKWLEEGRIGKVNFAENSIGFVAGKDPANRYFNPALGGGASYDITVYTYEITTYLLGNEVKEVQLSSVPAETGVDVTDHVVLRYADKIAALNTSIVAALEEKLVIYGDKGRIEVPHSHFASEAFLYDASNHLSCHFEDRVTQDGFTYEMQEAMDCIRAGRIESPVIPHADTAACASLLEKLSVYAGGR